MKYGFKNPKFKVLNLWKFCGNLILNVDKRIKKIKCRISEKKVGQAGWVANSYLAPCENHETVYKMRYFRP